MQTALDIKVRGAGRVITVAEQCRALDTDEDGGVYVEDVPLGAMDRLIAFFHDRTLPHNVDRGAFIPERHWRDFLNTL